MKRNNSQKIKFLEDWFDDMWHTPKRWKGRKGWRWWDERHMLWVPEDTFDIAADNLLKSREPK